MSRAVRLGRVAAVVVSLTPAAAHADKIEECVLAHEQAQQKSVEKKLVEALSLSRSCAVPVCPAPVRKECRQWQAELEKSVPTIIVTVRRAGRELSDARVSVDGKAQDPGKEISLDPGAHMVVAEIEDQPKITRQIEVREGERSRMVSVSFTETPVAASAGGGGKDPAADAAPGRSIPTASYVLGGVGIAGFIGFGAMALVVAQDEKDLDECKPRCDQADVDSLGTKYLIGDIALGIGLAGVASAVGVYFLQSPSEEVAVGIGPTSARLRLRF